VAVPDWLMDQIAGTCPRENRVPPWRVFPGLTPSVIGNVMWRACKAAGIVHRSPHDMRRTATPAFRLAVTQVAAKLGHSKKALRLTPAATCSSSGRTLTGASEPKNLVIELLREEAPATMLFISEIELPEGKDVAAFEEFMRDEYIPAIHKGPTRVGQVAEVELLRGETSETSQRFLWLVRWKGFQQGDARIDDEAVGRKFEEFGAEMKQRAPWEEVARETNPQLI
jgi:hypothetical protein